MSIPEAELLAALPRLRRYARSLTRGSGEAEDLLQDSLARALARQDSWRGQNLPAWLAAVMTSVFRNRGRRDRGAGRRGDLAEADELAAPLAELDPLQRRRLAAALDQLAPEARAVLMLVVVEGYSYAEVAAALDIPPGTVMSRLSRARKTVAEILGGENVVPFSRHP